MAAGGEGNLAMFCLLLELGRRQCNGLGGLPQTASWLAEQEEYVRLGGYSSVIRAQCGRFVVIRRERIFPCPQTLNPTSESCVLGNVVTSVTAGH
ncbi:hypothetical protein BDP55DRAFT_658377 [Colletotrichum godetiae]|uniref:Uncharacterized protein n=1 Tax=Colletotrichum godetiae TaxID=1209918 RepID=A0AAJ0APJ3_9PEZI|nr:uncharacterized protein BDP55DRAFT_658377 [Colletotrichum godetiae]KAK1688020.1 hypothetical protein BDP55DRAFT_658377 [Colletotrichum godetiae]